jgi:hypothetical protein
MAALCHVHGPDCAEFQAIAMVKRVTQWGQVSTIDKRDGGIERKNLFGTE